MPTRKKTPSRPRPARASDRRGADPESVQEQDREPGALPDKTPPRRKPRSAPRGGARGRRSGDETPGGADATAARTSVPPRSGDDRAPPQPAQPKAASPRASAASSGARRSVRRAPAATAAPPRASAPARPQQPATAAPPSPPAAASPEPPAAWTAPPSRAEPGTQRDWQLPPLPPEPLVRRLRHRWRRSAFARRWLPAALGRLGAYARLTRIDRPIGTFLLLWPTLWALWLAGDGHPSPLHFVVFVAGTFLMRSAGCAINDFADRGFDPHVWRTRSRPLAKGEIRPAEALAVFAVLALAALGLAFTLDRLALLLAIPGAFLAATYPFMKRYTHLPQLYLGVAFGWGIPMAFAAETGALPPVAWLLLIVNVIWATAYDTMYAMADRPDDVKIGVKSTAILFGEMDRTIVAILQGSVLLGLALAGLRLEAAPVYYWGLGAAACFGLYQQWLIRKREPQRCFRAFLNNNWFGAAVFAGIILQTSFHA